MIDTIRVKFLRPLSQDQLRDWDQLARFKADGTVTRRFVRNLELDPTDMTTDHLLPQLSVRATYFPVDYQGHPNITLEFSLPKAVFGNNYTMLTDLQQAVDCANQRIATIPRLPALDISEGILIRIDLCYNHQVGPRVGDYINAIAMLEYPHRRTKLHRNEGAEFRSKHTTTKFYDKLRESLHPDAYGILRQESTYLDPKRIANFLGKDHPTLQDVTPEWSVAMLNSDLKRLNLLDRTIANADTAFASLCETYGAYAGPYYWAILKNMQTTNKPTLARKMKLHPRSLDRRIKGIADAGIALTLTESSEPLPPLEIHL